MSQASLCGKKDWLAVRQLPLIIGAQLAPFNSRPHWGKLFTMLPTQLHSDCEKLPDYQQLLRAYDPKVNFATLSWTGMLFEARH